MSVNLGKTNVMVSADITKDDLSESKDNPCEVCRLRAKAKSVLCVQCGKWIHGRCAGVKIVTTKFLINFAYMKCEGNIVEALEQ